VRIHSRLGFAHQEMRGPLPSGSATISRTNLSTDGDAAAAGLIPLDLAEFVRIKKSPILTTYLSYSCKIMCAEKTTSVPAAEVEKRFDYYRDRAANEPILILKNGRPETVLLSYDEFVRLKGRQAYSIDDLPAHLVTAILEAKIPDELEGAKS
jgi:hypothetical protein